MAAEPCRGVESRGWEPAETVSWYVEQESDGDVVMGDADSRGDCGFGADDLLEMQRQREMGVVVQRERERQVAISRGYLGYGPMGWR